MTKQEVLKACIDKQMEPFLVGYDFVMDHPEIGDKPWYHHFTFDSKSEYEDWRAFCISVFRKELHQTKAQAEKEFQWLDLCFGLKQDYTV